MSDARNPGPPGPRRRPRGGEVGRWEGSPLPFEFDDATLPPSAFGGTTLGVGNPAPGSPPPPAGGDTIELAEVLSILRRRAWLVLLCVVLGVGLALALAQRQSPVYTATAVIRVEDPTSQVSEQISWNWYGSRGGTDPVLSTLEVLRSRALLGELVDREGLRLAPVSGPLTRSSLEVFQVGEFALADTLTVQLGPDAFQTTSTRTGESARARYGEAVAFGEVRFSVTGPPAAAGNEPAILAVQDRDQAIGWVQRSLDYQIRPETNIVDIRFTSPEPALAQRVVNQAVQVFASVTLDQARRNNQRRRLFLEEQLAQADSTLRESQDRLSEFRSAEQVSSTQSRAAAQQTGLLSIEMRREELAADRSTYNALLSGIRTAEAGDMARRLEAIAASPEVAGNPVVGSLYGQLLEYESERQRLTSGPWGLSERNPDVARLDQQIATTRGRLEAAVRSHLDAVDARLAALDDLRGRQASQVASLPRAEAEEARLLQQVQSVQRTAEQLRDEFYRAQIAEAVQEGPIEILDPATGASASEGAGLGVMLALGLLLGGMTGSGGAFLLEMLNTTMRRREDVEAVLHVGMVGTIPRLPKQRLKLMSGKRRKGAEATGSSLPAGQAPGAELVTFHQGRSGHAESFRTLRTNLLFHESGGAPLRTVVVSSAVPGEGKTTTASNLAVAYAQQGLRVLLVDCDLRKPRVNELFRIERKPGITELVLGQASLRETVRTFEAVENLYILPAGQLPPNPTELLGGNRMREVLNTLREEFDIVILDTPPLSGGADGAILGAMVDGVLLVVRAGQTDREQVRHAGRQLATVGANLLGAVMNDPDGEGERYGRYAYQYEYYG
jgi:polysaccharide biosynthesis transport protein